MYGCGAAAGDHWQMADIQGKPAGEFYMSLFEFQTEYLYAYSAVLFNIAFTIVTVLAATVRRPCGSAGRAGESGRR